MLVDIEKFKEVENLLTSNGKLQGFFENAEDELMGRMMITRGKIPDELGIDIPDNAKVFIGSFDFYDSTVGVAIDTKTKEVFGGIWITPQKENDESPTEEWIKFFVGKLLEGITDDGECRLPIYSFIGNCHDMTVYPTR